jgi:hypothetical protein
MVGLCEKYSFRQVAVCVMQNHSKYKEAFAENTTAEAPKQ